MYSYVVQSENIFHYHRARSTVRGLFMERDLIDLLVRIYSISINFKMCFKMYNVTIEVTSSPWTLKTQDNRASVAELEIAWGEAPY